MKDMTTNARPTLAGRRRTAVAAAVGALGLFVLLLALAPWLFRERIEAAARSAVNDAVEAEVAWSGVRLSLLRSFPSASLTMDELAITGVGRFEGETLATLQHFRLVLQTRSLVSAFRGTGPLMIREVELVEPEVRLIVLEDGSANWDIFQVPEGEVGTTAQPLELTLRGLRVLNGSVALDDRQNGLRITADGLQHSLTGDFRQERFALQTRTGADAVSIRFAGVPMLSRAEVQMDADLGVDRASGTITLADAGIRVNALRLGATGSVEMGEDRTQLDLAFDAPSSDIREILSLVPGFYAPGLAELRTSGTMAVSGWVRGAYGTDAFPAFAVNAAVQDGSFHFADLELPAREINATFSMTNPGGDADLTMIDLSRFRTVIGNEPIDGRLSVRTPISDPMVDFAVSGTVRMDELARTVKLEDVEDLAGVIVASAELRARSSDLDAQRYDRVYAAGDVRVTGLAMSGGGLQHPVAVDEAHLALSPLNARLTELRGRVGSSDVELSGVIENLAAYLVRGDDLRVTARLASNRFDMNEWRSDDELEAVLVPANIDFALDAEVAQLIYGDLDLRNARGSLRLLAQRATLEQFRLEAFGGSMVVGGFYETVDPSRPLFDLALRVRDIDVAAAAREVVTLRAVAPVVSHAHGRISTDLRLSGALGEDLTPLLDVLAGSGLVETDGLSLRGFPVMERLADALEMELLREPTLVDLAAAFTIGGGRLHVTPFDVALGSVGMTVSGSNGFDQSLDYTLNLRIPTGAVGESASRTIATLASRFGRSVVDLQSTRLVPVDARITGTVGNPAISLDMGSAVRAVAGEVRGVVDAELVRRREEVQRELEEAVVGARAELDLELARRVEEAERQAAEIRARAREAAEATRLAARERAEELVGRAEDPLTRAAARTAANRLLREADEQAENVVREADARAESRIADARRGAGLGSD